MAGKRLGRKTFEQTLVPLHGGRLTIPPIPLAVFDPVLGRYAAIETALVRAPSDVEDAYRAAVAVTLADERTRALGALRDRGILVVDVPAAELTIALLDAYVDVKSRGLL